VKSRDLRRSRNVRQQARHILLAAHQAGSGILRLPFMRAGRTTRLVPVLFRRPV
jgi:hypothetical protein